MWTRIVLVLLVAVLLQAPSGLAVGAEPARPGLILLISVDQLRRDRLDERLPGGLGRIAREGQVHSEAALAHATTETCPGHTSMLTGRHPGPAGVPVNRYIEPKTGETRYCVWDPSPDAAVIGLDPTAGNGRSPRNLRAETLGDWLKAADAGARVFAVSGKDRAAITLGGRQPDAVYWLRRSDAPGFTTSRYYRTELPGWVADWNAVPLSDRLPAKWTHASTGEAAGPGRPDDYPGESDERSRTSPHPLYDDNPGELVENVYASPFIDELTLAFARRLIEAEGLGQRPAGPDLLAVSLSGLDTVGHAYGPWSLESRDALLRLDGWLAEFLTAVEEQVGAGRVLVALTSDHGVLPLPEWLAQTGALACPLEGGRRGLISFILGLQWELHFELSPYSWPGAWMHASSQLTVNRELAREHDIPVERVVAVAERWLEAQPSVREAWTRLEIERGESDLARLYRNSFDPERSGDLAVQFERTCLPDFTGEGTTHGSPYPYDRDVPIVFWGAGVEARHVAGPAATVDIAPSLATRAGVPVPDGLDGHSLLVGSPSGPGRDQPSVASGGTRPAR